MEQRKTRTSPHNHPILSAMAFVLLFCAMAACFAIVRRPTLVSHPLVQSVPLDAADAEFAPHMRDKVIEVLKTAGRARVDGPHATQLLRPWHDPMLTGFRLDIDARGQVTIALSERVGNDWANVLLRAGAFEMENGVITQLEVESIEVSGWDLSAVWGHADLSLQANEYLDEARKRHPKTARMLDALDSVRVVGDDLEVVVAPHEVATAFGAR